MVVVNNHTSPDLIKGFLALKATGVCKVIFEGTPADFTNGSVISFDLADSLVYALAVRSLVSEIRDSHGFLSNVNNVTPIRKPFGFYPPIRTAFIEGKLWVIDIGKDSTQDLSRIQLWDEIISIDGKDITTATNSWRNYFATSNQITFQREVIYYLLNGPKDSKIRLGVNRNEKLSPLELIRSGRTQPSGKLIDFNDDYPVVKTLSDSVAYINMGALSNNSVDSTFNAFQKTKAIVFDMRNYPRGTAWTTAPRLTSVPKEAVFFVKPMVNYAHVNGGESKENTTSSFTVGPDRKHKTYTGKVIILCNGNTQSQAEYSIMMFQAATKATVVGSQTAGADGNVTTVVLPGGYLASFSGLGILYPDGTETQRTGIKIDILIKPTVDGLKKGKDELLDRALEYIAKGK